MRRPPLDKKEVRQAICYAIDRQFIADKSSTASLSRRTGRCPRSSGPAGFYHRRCPSLRRAGPLDIANRLMDEAGLPRKAGGMRIPLFLEVNSFGEQWLRQARIPEAGAGAGRHRPDAAERGHRHLAAPLLHRLRLRHQRALLSAGADPVVGDTAIILHVADPQGHHLRQQQELPQRNRGQAAGRCDARADHDKRAAIYQPRSSRSRRGLPRRSGCARCSTSRLQQEVAGPHHRPARHLPSLRARLVGRAEACGAGAISVPGCCWRCRWCSASSC